MKPPLRITAVRASLGLAELSAERGLLVLSAAYELP